MRAIRRWTPPLQATRDALFVGWFGPIGVSAVLYATEAMKRTGEAGIWPVVSLIVCGLLLAHGVTATHFTRWYARASKGADDSAGEGRRDR